MKINQYKIKRFNRRLNSARKGDVTSSNQQINYDSNTRQPKQCLGNHYNQNNKLQGSIIQTQVQSYRPVTADQTPHCRTTINENLSKLFLNEQESEKILQQLYKQSEKIKKLLKEYKILPQDMNKINNNIIMKLKLGFISTCGDNLSDIQIQLSNRISKYGITKLCQQRYQATQNKISEMLNNRLQQLKIMKSY